MQWRSGGLAAFHHPTARTSHCRLVSLEGSGPRAFPGERSQGWVGSPVAVWLQVSSGCLREEGEGLPEASIAHLKDHATHPFKCVWSRVRP